MLAHEIQHSNHSKAMYQSRQFRFLKAVIKSKLLTNTSITKSDKDLWIWNVQIFCLLFELNLGFCGTDIPSASTSLCKKIFWGVSLVINRITSMRCVEAFEGQTPEVQICWACWEGSTCAKVAHLTQWSPHLQNKKVFFWHPWSCDLDFRFVLAWRAHRSHPDDLLEKMFDQRKSKNGGTHLERPQAFGFLPPLFRVYRSFQFIHGRLVELYDAPLINAS